MYVSPLFLLSGLGMIAVGVGFVIFWKLRTKLPMAPFLLGAAAWAVSVALKAGFAVLCNRQVKSFLSGSLKDSAADPLFWLYIGLLTGVFECGLVLLLTLWPKIRHYKFSEAVAFGVGFGAVEAAIIGLAGLALVVVVMVAPGLLPKAVLDAYSGVSLWTIPAPIVERLSAVVLHTFACVLILIGARQKRWGYFWLSFAYKTLVDAAAAWGQLGIGVDTLGHIWLLESVVAAFGIVGLLGLRWLSAREGLAAPGTVNAINT